MKRRLLILLTFLALMVGLLLNIARNGTQHMALKELYARTLELETARNEVAQLQLKRRELIEQLELNYLALEDIQLRYEDLITTEVEHFKMISGSTALEGPGVVIFVNDGSRELIDNEDPNNVLVHDIDVRSMVDDLRNAGAEAISINGQRILLQESRIYCTGPTIRINDQIFAPPYVIKAIGDRKFLEAAINAPGNFSEILRGWGVHVEVNTAISVEVPPIERLK